MVIRQISLVIVAGFLVTLSQSCLGNDDFVTPANRWAIVIDTTAVDAAKNANTGEMYASFKNELVGAGLEPDHVLVFSARAQDGTMSPTRDRIAKILSGIKNPDRNRLPDPTGKTSNNRRIRQVDGPCEVQLYITAGGVANKEQTRNLIVPSGVDVTEITQTDDKRLVSLNEFEDALISPEEDQTPIERTLLVVNFLSLHSVTRGGAADHPLREIDISNVPTRGADSSVLENDQTRFLHLRILTKNEQVSDQTAESFYQLLEKGIHGYADISGNQDGIVQADELTQYIESNGRRGSVEVARNGNDSFPLSRTQQKIDIPEGLFKQIGEAFTLDKYSQERQSAYEREESVKSQRKGTLR